MGVIKNPVLLRIMGMLERTTYRLADAIIALSPGIREGVVKYSNPSTPVVMIPNGCDIDLIQQTENSHIDRLDEIIPGVSAAKLRAVFTGAHGQANGLDAILDTAKELKKRERTDIYLVLIGDGKMKPELMRRALQEKLDNVVFAGYIPKTELMKVMRHMHVGLMVLADVPAFYYGTSPNKFFDYISLGLPVINNYPGWLADMVGNYKCGLAVAPKNPKAFADALMQLADEPGIRKKMGNKAEQLAADLFDRRRLSNQFADCLENAMES
jgi:glycosyltransferase involved in cell wall biosynthesis